MDNASDIGEWPKKMIDATPQGSMMNSMRHSTHNDATTIGDLFDNSIDAGANNIRAEYVEKGEHKIVITDDGCGMDEQTLTRALTLGPSGSRVEGDLGVFGLGMKTAATSRGRCFTVETMTDGGVLLKATYDLDIITDPSTSWKIPLEEFTEEADKEAFLSRLFTKSKSGTILTISRLDKTSSNTKKAFESNILQYVARTYCKQIFGGLIKFYVGKKRVEARDPMESQFESRGVSVGASRNYISEIISSPDGEITVGSIIVNHNANYDLEEFSKSKTANWRGLLDFQLNNANSGIYVYRNGREIVQLPFNRLGIKSHPSQNRLRFELRFTDENDKYLSLSNSKDSINCPDSLKDKLLPIVRQRIAGVHALYKSRKKIANLSHEREGDEEAQKKVRRAEDGKVLPRIKNKKNPSVDTADGKTDGNSRKGKKKPGRQPYTKTSMMAPIEYVDLGVNGVLFEHYVNERNRICLRINKAHVYYAEYFGSENIDANTHHEAFSIFQFAQAYAMNKMMVEDDTLTPIFENFMIEFSRALKNISSQ
jgi:hypothetical protein